MMIDFFVKPTKSAKALMPTADMELPYEGQRKCFVCRQRGEQRVFERIVGGHV